MASYRYTLIHKRFVMSYDQYFIFIFCSLLLYLACWQSVFSARSHQIRLCHTTLDHTRQHILMHTPKFTLHNRNTMCSPPMQQPLHIQPPHIQPPHIQLPHIQLPLEASDKSSYRKCNIFKYESTTRSILYRVPVM